MLLRIVIKNFLSFFSKTEFNMFPNPKREYFQEHINTNSQIPLLKQSIIYGANGSGKSNFVKVFGFLRSFVTEEEFLSSIEINAYKYQLVETNIEPISFEIEFSHRNKCFIYKVDIDTSINEWLYVSGMGIDEDQLIFHRNGSKLESPYLYVQNNELSRKLLQKNKQTSLIALNRKYPIINNSDLDAVDSWFKSSLKLISINSKVPALIELMSKNAQLYNFANTLLQRLNVANALEIKQTPLDVWMTEKDSHKKIMPVLEDVAISETAGITAMANNRTSFSISVKDGVKMVSEFLFDQLGTNNYHKKMDIASQSDGTVRLLTLLPAIYDAIRGDVVFIDEIENSMHPNLIYELVKYYANIESKGQLIFTTHLTKFLNQQELVRPDELWMVEKKSGDSEMRSFNDFKIHHTISIENGYIDGRYGGVPHFESSSDFEG